MSPGRRTLLAAVLAAPWVAMALLRGLALDRWHPLVSLVAFTPYAAATALVPVLVALALRRRTVAVVAALAAAWLAVAVLPRAFGDPPRPPAGAPTLTVLSANLYVGRADARALVALARRERADVLSLHETTPGALRRLDAAGLDAWPDRAADATQSAVLARRGRLPRALGSSAARRAALSVALGDRQVVVEAVHPLPPISRANVRSWRATLRALPAAGPGPLRVLAGDFNATLDHRELRRILDRGYADAGDVTGDGLRPTWPMLRRRPRITIDHVLADARLAIVRYEAHTLPGTDHRAVLAEVALR